MNDRRSGSDRYRHVARRTSAGAASTGVLIGGVAIAVVAVLAVVAFALTKDSPSEAAAETAAVQVSGESLPAYPRVSSYIAPPEQDPAVGLVPPTLTGQDFDGDAVTIDPSGNDGPMMVVFVAHTCPHCQKEVPVIQQWVDDGGLPDDVDLWAVNTGVNPNGVNYPPSEWLEREGWSEGVLLDSDQFDAAKAWGLQSYPYMVFLDADGKVVARASGELPIGEIEAILEQISS